MTQATFLPDYVTEETGYCILKEARQRVADYGTAVLSQMEALSLVVGEQGALLWQRYGSLKAIAAAPLNELMELPGIGKAGAMRLKATLELGRRLAVESAGDRPQITCPEDVQALVGLEMRDLQQEHLRALILDTKSNLIKQVTLYIGNVNTVVVRIGEVLKPVIQASAVNFILVHNHPSGDPTPSNEDINITRRIREAGKMIDINLIDHIIIGHNRFYSINSDFPGGLK